jgi:hypothetical protein
MIGERWLGFIQVVELGLDDLSDVAVASRLAAAFWEWSVSDTLD